MSSEQNPTSPARASGPLAGLRRFARTRTEVEPCELCGAAIRPEHQHLLNTVDRKLLCACDACVILLSGGPGARFRQIPRRVEFWPDFRLTDAQWESLRIPIQLAFFFRSTQAGKVVALYPGPAGVTESAPPPDAWQELLADNPRLAQLEPDVEALLVSRLRDNRGAYRVPIDECYRLTGLIRARWRGFSGGTEVWQQVHNFFAELKQRSQTTGEAADA
jgi:hypothetical protein